MDKCCEVQPKLIMMECSEPHKAELKATDFKMDQQDLVILPHTVSKSV